MHKLTSISESDTTEHRAAMRKENIPFHCHYVSYEMQ